MKVITPTNMATSLHMSLKQQTKSLLRRGKPLLTSCREKAKAVATKHFLSRKVEQESENGSGLFSRYRQRSNRSFSQVMWGQMPGQGQVC